VSEDNDNKKLIMDALKAMGAKSVVVSYSGSGDSGQIDDCVIDDDHKKDVEIEAFEEVGKFDDKNGWSRSIELKKRKLTEVIKDYCDNIIDQEHGGYYNNDGGDGIFELDVEAGTMTLTHNDHYTSSHTTTHNFAMSTTFDEMAEAVSPKKKKKKGRK
jgi:hypothetical protein